MSSVDQAQAFLAGAEHAAVMAAKPLLIYYGFLNLAKALCLANGINPTYDRAKHGLSEKLNPNGRELVGAYLEAEPSPLNGHRRVFSDLLCCLTGSPLPGDTNFDLPVLLPQVVPGHRLWASAAKKQERFIATSEIEALHNANSQQLWLSLSFSRADLSRLNLGHKRLLRESGLDASFQLVSHRDPILAESYVCLEQRVPLACTDHPSDELLDLFASLSPRIWTTVSSVPPYRRHYVYVATAAEQPFVLPQLASIYAIAFYLSSITRYRPHHFDKILLGAFGPRVQEFIRGQPIQFLYLIASQFAKQDVARPAIV